MQETTRTMLLEAKLLDNFWKEAFSTIVWFKNIAQLWVNNDKAPYELYKGKPNSVKYFKKIGRKCYMKVNDDKLGNFDS